MEVLTAFIREQWPPSDHPASRGQERSTRPDVQAALTAVGRRDIRLIDLGVADLTRASLNGAVLSGASLIRADLNAAYLDRTNLTRVTAPRQGELQASDLGFYRVRGATAPKSLSGAPLLTSEFAIAAREGTR